MKEYKVESNDCVLKAISENYDCAIIYCPTSGAETLNVVKFEVGKTPEKVTDLISSSVLTKTD